MKIKPILQNIRDNIQLNRLARRSDIIMKKYKKETFNSKTLSDLFTDEFIYKGDKPNTTLVMNKDTGKPEEVSINVTRRRIANQYCISSSITDKDGDIVSKKDFILLSDYLKGWSMQIGNMMSSGKNLCGLGIRQDQFQIETAINCGVGSVPRSSLSGALLYHTKMGFMPVKSDGKKINNLTELNEEIAYVQSECPDINKESIVPIISKRGRDFYFDMNRTMAVTSLREIKLRQMNGEQKITDNFCWPIELSLSGEELQKWRELIGKYSITRDIRVDKV